MYKDKCANASQRGNSEVGKESARSATQRYLGAFINFRLSAAQVCSVNAALRSHSLDSFGRKTVQRWRLVQKFIHHNWQGISEEKSYRFLEVIGLTDFLESKDR